MKMNTALRTTLAVAAMTALGGCDILDVENPNNLVQEDIEAVAAAAALVNGAFAQAAEGVSDTWLVYLVVSDELVWNGSRDAWGALDQGFLGDPNNEFVDGAFPDIAQARWTADNAVEIIQGHVDSGETTLQDELANAQLIAGTVYTVIAETQEETTFSDMSEAGPLVDAAGMIGVFDQAISHLDNAVTNAQAAGDSEIEVRALAMRARAKQSRAIRQKIQPTPNTADPLVSDAGATADAQAVIDMVGGTDWRWQFEYSASTLDNNISSWINSRAEIQVGANYVDVDPEAPKKITATALLDPITAEPDREITRRVAENFQEGQIYLPLTIVDERMMHLILAEAALADGGDFAGAINEIRVELDGITGFSGQIPAQDMLIHERSVNTFLMGVRLGDMYRFGLQDLGDAEGKDPRDGIGTLLWQPAGETVTAPGTLLPIAITELRANCNLNGQGC